MSAYRIDILQFMQEITASILELHGITYIRAVNYDRLLGFHNWPAIVYAVMCLCQGIYRSHSSHVLSVLSFANKSGLSQTYTNRLGDRLFSGREFSWKIFRGFVALIVQMSFFSYRENQIFLSDDFVTSASIYIYNKLQRQINDHHGWEAFQLDCVRIVLRGKQDNDPLPDLGSQSSKVNFPTSTRSATVAKMVSFRKETYGKVYTFDPEKNAFVLDPVDRAGQSSQGMPSRSATSEKMDIEESTNLVREIIKMSKEVLESMRNDYEQQSALGTITIADEQQSFLESIIIGDVQQNVLKSITNENVQQNVLESMANVNAQQCVLESMKNVNMQQDVLESMKNINVQQGVLESMTNMNVQQSVLESMTNVNGLQGVLESMTNDNVQGESMTNINMQQDVLESIANVNMQQYVVESMTNVNVQQDDKCQCSTGCFGIDDKCQYAPGCSGIDDKCQYATGCSGIDDQ